MHFVLVKISRNSMLLTNNLLKRGDVEILARSEEDCWLNNPEIRNKLCASILIKIGR